MTSQRIPKTDSIDELSKFWDSHDLTDFDDQLEEVRVPVFARRKESTVAVLLTPKEALALRRLAQSEGVEETKLVRKWVREKLRASSFKMPPNKPLQPAAQKTRRCMLKPLGFCAVAAISFISGGTPDPQIRESRVHAWHGLR